MAGEAATVSDDRAGHERLRSGTRATVRPIRASLRRYAGSLRKNHDAVLALRSNPATAAAWMDWYLDNEYLIRRVLAMLRRSLSAEFASRLPVLVSGAEAGSARTSVIARQGLQRTEHLFDLNATEAVVLERLETAALSTAELWALPLLLRFESLRAVFESVERLLAASPASSHDPDRDNTQASVSSAALVANGVRSLHRLERTDWRGFVERTSAVERTLAGDPARVYPAMDFETRDAYRGAVEKLSRLVGCDEVTVARAAIELARRASAGEALAGHVGHYLIGEGRAHLTERLGYQPPLHARLRDRLRPHRQALFLGLLTVTSLVFVFIPVLYALYQGSLLWAGLTALLALVPALIIASTLLHWGITLTRPPRALPRLDFAHGIPHEHRAVVCICALISSIADVSRLLGQVERHYLASSDADLRFGLLTGLFDAPTQTTERDAPILDALREGIERLNQRYGEEDGSPFFWLHRQRVFNARDGVWMEWERKRGKLRELNQFILRGDEGTFGDQAGAVADLRGIPYVLTLDTDTVLPVDAARRLIGTIAHPLNRPVLQPETCAVVSGYSILQPRVEIDPVTATRNLFTRAFSGDRGLDVYTLAVSDAYQDLFGEGIYTGKGLYDVHAFEASLHDAVPEAAVLSHDLFEGIHGRTALVSDVVVYEDYPVDYLAYLRRLHRWVRGDWQLLPWLGRWVPTASGSRRRNRLEALDRWQIVHNLLRSLLAPVLVAMLVCGWFILPGSPLHWTILALVTLLVPSLAGAVGLVRSTLRRRRAAGLLFGLGGDLRRWLLSIALLPYEALTVADAVCRSLYRTHVSGRNLLEWTPAAADAAAVGNQLSPGRLWRAMWPVTGLTVIVGLSLVAWRPAVLWVAAPVLLLWLVAPAIVLALRRESAPPRKWIRAEDRTHLRRVARRTWLFFERFVGPEDHWLPPDHFQEEPRGVVAHRTSPTNIGLLLLSNAAAYDLGYIDAEECLVRCRNTLRTVESMTHFRGHLLNWYDTHHLTPLAPAYVSTVDSGNLLGCLLTVKRTAAEIGAAAVWRQELFEGLLDATGVMEDSVAKSASAGVLEALGGELHALRSRVLETRRQPDLWPALVDELTETIRTRIDPRVEAVLHDPGGLPPETLTDLRVWLERSHHHMLRIRECRDRFMAWWPLFAAMPAILATDDTPDAMREAVDELRASLECAPSCIELEGLPSRIAPQLAELRSMLAAVETSARSEAEAWLDRLEAAVMRTSAAASVVLAIAGDVESTCERLFVETDMRFLYDGIRHLFHIGYDVDRGRMDDNAYDLLASESRLASFLAIAKGDVPARHWAHLGRPLTRDGPDVMLLSWSGTMFEYLMPGLLMPEPRAGLLARSAEGAIASQIRFAAGRGIPWGISESGYYLFDPARNYAYRAFGAPSLALQAARGVEDLVVSPYATFLALPWRPHAATDNLRRLETLGMLGRYGYFEAVDFTPNRLDVGRSHALVRSYMAHHHGMSLVSVANALTTRNAITRFSAEPRYGACKLLLQERMPSDPELEYPASPSAAPRQAAVDTIPALDPWDVPVDTPTPRVHLLSNGRYGVFASNSGGGGSFWNDIALTRWSADSTTDDRGCWLYLQDVGSDDVWSIPKRPASIRQGDGQVRFHAHAVEYLRHSRGLVQTLEVTVCPRDDAELRRITLTNHGDQTRQLLLTTYAEVVLGDVAADRQHPRFSGLFVKCAYDAERSLLLFQRRSREGAGDGPLLGEFLVDVRGVIKPDGVETDRGAFLARDGSLARATMPVEAEGSDDAVDSGLDPIASMRKTVTLKPGATVRLALVRIVAPTHEALLQTRNRFAYWANVQYAFGEASARIARDLHRGGIDSENLHDLVRLTSAMLCPHPDLRASPGILAGNRLGQRGLWGMGISGDHPILLLTVPQSAGMDAVILLLKAHEFWRKRNLPIDVVFLATGDEGYSGNTRDALHRAISLRHAEPWIGRRGGLFVNASASLGEADVTLLHAAASVVLDAGMRSLSVALDRLNNADIPLPQLPVRPGSDFPTTEDVAPALPADLQFRNGFGGFTPDGREYVMLVEGGHRPPAAWINVIANPEFGCTVSESGGGYTWWLNSGENRLTPWRNDPVLDTPGECIYLRDEETGDLWCPTPGPTHDAGAYLVRHGPGYSQFEHRRLGVGSVLSLSVDVDHPVKIARLRLANHSERARRFTVTFYAEWVLGTRREASAGYLIPSWNARHRALLVRNPYAAECPEQVAFLATTRDVHGYTADRTEFLGRDGGLHAPAGLSRVGLSGRVDAGRDTCAALQVHVDLPAAGSEEVVFLLGAGADEEAALALIRGCRDDGAIQRMGTAVDHYWEDRLGAVTLKSPDAATDILFNSWLLYQTLASRLHGRTGLYQSSGAFGFRDQLQDTTALLATAPALCRAQILAAAARQFPEGDVLHWWHPPAARGVRTRISDDLLWLPWVVCEYLAVTDDAGVLDESVPWLVGDPLGEDEGDRYSEYAQSDRTASLYEHCLQAIRRVDHSGRHGLPLMGAGDWNDGFNRVGNKGRGESVWLGWFLLDTLRRFAPVCEARGDLATAQLLAERATTLTQALRSHAWDGRWYRRAYHDDGTPLGTEGADACEIDAIAQSWAVLSGGDGSGREQQAMEAVAERLVRADDGLVLLFEPPFREGVKDVGYIGAYPPGVRENGGQYTHAAAWTGLAYARLGDAARTAKVLRMLNPINHALTEAAARHYRVEPYVLAADVYGYPPRVGRGGWTWYTGSAAWYYRFILEGVLGITRRGDSLIVSPCLPPDWPGATVTWRHRGTVHHIDLVRAAGAPANALVAPCTIPLLADGVDHRIAVRIGPEC